MLNEIRIGPNSWLWTKKLAGGKTAVGLTEDAADECGLIVHVELPVAGDHVLQGHPCLLIETLAGEIELPPPVSGKVVLVNGMVEKNPGILHYQPGDRCWLMEVEEAEGF